MSWERSAAFERGYSKVRSSKDVFLDSPKQAEIVFVGRFLHSFITEKVIHVHSLIKSTGRIDLDYLNKRGLSLTYSYGFYGTACAEYVLWALLSLSRRFILTLNKNYSESDWSLNPNSKELSELKILLVGGKGEVGSALSRVLKPFNPLIYIVDREVDKKDVFLFVNETGVDVVVSLLSKNPTTLNFFDSEFFTSLKKPIYFIDISRGGITDFQALEIALESGIVSAAFVDVFPQEPPDYENKLFRHPNFFFTPHIAGVSTRADYLMGRIAGYVVEHLEKGDIKKHYSVGEGYGYIKKL